MSATPHQERSSSPNSRYHIRVVPYSPPRISSDGSGASVSPRPVSGADSPLSPPDHISKSTVEEIAQREPGAEHSPYSLGSDVSGLRRDLDSDLDSPRPPSVQSQYGNVHASFPTPSPASDSDNAPGSASPLSPVRRARKVINIHSDKTFSLVPHSRSSSSRTGSFRSPPSSFTVPSSSYGRSSDAFADEPPSTPLTPLAEHFSSPDISPSPKPKRIPDSTPSSPRHHFVHGLRQVPTTPDTKPRRLVTSSPQTPPPAIVSLQEIENPASIASQRPLSTQSLQSLESSSTLSDRTNYKIYGQSSPVVAASTGDAANAPDLDLLPPSSSHSNYHVLGESSSSNQSVYEQPRPQTSDTDANYVVHGGPSASSLSIASSGSRLRPEYSQESLIVPPLRPVKQRSFEISSLSRSRSRDSLRTGSLTSISSVITQEATRALFVGAATLSIQPVAPRQNIRSVSSVTNPHSSCSMPPQPQPHHWSSQLSTVFSESEGGSDPPTRSVSPLSVHGSLPGRRSSGFNSAHSRHILSISSSLAGLEEVSDSNSHSRSGSLEPPQPTFNRHAIREPYLGNIRLIRDHDEDGDGLADLHDLHHRPSRSRLPSFVSSHSADRNLWSSSSSRANSLSNNSTIPVWARLYYGSGERRLLIQASSDSLHSQYNDSRPGSSLLSRSPSLERFASHMFPGRRLREPEPQPKSALEPRPQSIDMTSNPIMNVARGLKKQSSSIWSPHLQHDKRATRYSIWEPPSAVWSAESGPGGHRSLQVLMFIVGFVFPFAWMIAAFMPLPSSPGLEAAERLESTSHLDLHQEPARNGAAVAESRYRSARWWRSVNRMMSVIGLLVIGTAVALAIVGTRQQWGR